MFNLDDIEIGIISTDKKLLEKPDKFVKSKDNTLSLNLLFKKANKYKLLSVDDEKYHLYKIKCNHADAKMSFNVLFNHNLKLVFSVARYYENKGVELHDLIQEGCLGLIEAIHKFDLSKNVRFSTYATNWIRQKVNKNIQEHSRTIRIPSSLNQLISKYHKYHKFMSSLFNRQPTVEEIAVCMNVPIHQMKEYLSNIPIVFSFDVALADDSQTFKDFICSNKTDEDVDKNDQINHLGDALNKLTFTDRYIVCSISGSFGYPKLTFKELAKLLELSKKEVQERYEYSLKHLKKTLQP